MKDKRKMRMANQAGLEATLRKGRMMDEMHNQKPTPEKVVVVPYVPVMVTTTSGDAEKIEPVSQEDKQEPAKKDAVPAKKTNITLSELEQIKARLLELERLETENRTS